MGSDARRSPALSRRRQTRPNISNRNSSGQSQTGFDRFNLRPQLAKAVADAGYTDPRPIQAEGLAPALAGKDVLGLAPTGTGKTAAFVLPILQRLLTAGRGAPRALVVAPTRELAAQVHTEFERLAVHTPLKSISIFGGVPIARQMRGLRQHPDIVVACPGRLLDLMNQRALKLDGVEVLVLDEADHMFDMGFLPDVRRILRACPDRRQNLMFSATMPREIRRLADEVLYKPHVVELAHSRPAETIDHALYPVSEGDKIGAVEVLLDGDDFRSAIVFSRTKRRAKQLAQRLEERGLEAIAMQGNMSQPQRERALKGFRDGRFKVLVATDIAARGLDIAGVSHVINFDVPNTPDAYTHRIGRTGRSEQTGTAYTFVTSDDRDQVRAIEKRLGQPIERRKISELGHLEKVTLKGAKGARNEPAGSNSRGRGNQGPRFAGKPGKSGGGGNRKPARPVRTMVRPPKPPEAPKVPAADQAAFGVGVGDGAQTSKPKRPQRGNPKGASKNRGSNSQGSRSQEASSETSEGRKEPSTRRRRRRRA